MVFQIILEVLIVLIGTTGLVAHSGLTTGELRRDFFRYYTNLSNLLVTVFYLCRLVVRIRGSYDGYFGRIVFSGLWFFAVTLCILLTFVIYHFVLVPGHKKVGDDVPEISRSFGNYCVHYIVPWLSLINWLIFADSSEFRYIWALLSTLLPWIYVAYAMIMGARGKIIEYTDSAYPYDFMDVGKHGWGIVLRNCLLVAAGFYACGMILLFLRGLI